MAASKLPSQIRNESGGVPAGARPLFVFAFAALTFVAAPAFAQARKIPKAGPSPTYGQLWLESFDFFASEQDDDSMNRLIQVALAEPTDSPEIIARVLEHRLARKERPALNLFASAIYRALNCVRESAKPACKEILRLWRGNLDSIFFYEDSPGLLVRARKLVEAKDCGGALGVVREVEAKEGETLPVLELTLDVQTCLGDTPAVAALRQRIELHKTLGYKEPQS